MNMPEQLSINYAPFTDWSAGAPRYRHLTPQKPSGVRRRRKSAATAILDRSLCFDESAQKVDGVGACAPGDYQKQWVVSTGQDIVIDDLLLRTANQQLAPITSVRTDGELIAHPLLIEQNQGCRRRCQA